MPNLRMESIIQQQTNNSGNNYCKMPDGTLIQWIGKYFNFINDTEYTDITINFPIAFYNASFMPCFSSYSTTTNKSNIPVFTVIGMHDDSVDVRVWRNDFSDISAGAPYIYVIAIGRWK